MNSRCSCILLSVLIVPILTCCNSFYSRGYDHAAVHYEVPDTLDKDAFIAYLDTAAVDDWEGLWLLLGPEQHCYLAIERINNYSHGAVYTHRIRLWEPHYVGWVYRVEPGVIVGYLEQGLYEGVKRVSLYEGFFFTRRRYDTGVRLDESRRFMLFDGYTRRNADASQVGMKRIYPIRTPDEREYKVRYL